MCAYLVLWNSHRPSYIPNFYIFSHYTCCLRRIQGTLSGGFPSTKKAQTLCWPEFWRVGGVNGGTVQHLLLRFACTVLEHVMYMGFPHKARTGSLREVERLFLGTEICVPCEASSKISVGDIRRRQRLSRAGKDLACAFLVKVVVFVLCVHCVLALQPSS